MIANADALHILPADIENAVHVRVEKCGGFIVGDGFDLAVIEQEGGLQQRLAVAGRAGARDLHARRELRSQHTHGVNRRLHRRALIVGVKRPQQRAVLIDEGKLRRGGACVDTEEAPAGMKRYLMNLRAVMASAEGVIFCAVRKQRRQTLELEGHLHAGAQLCGKRGGVCRLGIARLEGSAHGGEEVGILGVDDILRRQVQRADEGLFQLRQEVQRAAEKSDAAADGLAAGKAGDGLVDDGLKNGGSQIGQRCALVDERLDVRLGEHAAARGDGIELVIVGSGTVQSLGIRLQERGHLVDERAGAACADAVHALLQPAAEVDDLRILTAQLNGDVRLRGNGLQAGGHGDDLLHKADVQGLAEVDGAGAGDLQAQVAGAELCAGVLQQLGKCFLRVRTVAAVIAIAQDAAFVQNNELCGG